jgi:hypothetical protein
MSTPSTTLPRPTFSAKFPRTTGSTLDVAEPSKPAQAAEPSKAAQIAEKSTQLAERGLAFAKAHWKQIGLAALGLLGWRSRRLRPLLKKAAMMYAVPFAKQAYARARR